MTIRVMLLDDHPSLLDTLQNLLRGAENITVVARGDSGREAIAAVLDRQADVIVLDLRLPVMDGLELLRTIDDNRLGARMILLTGAVGETDISEGRVWPCRPSSPRRSRHTSCVRICGP